MAFYDRFKRKQKVVLPEEVNEYYQSQKRERVGVAIILGITALVITLLIAVALFFGGRFVYRKISGDPKKQPATVQTDKPNDILKQNDSGSSSSGSNQNKPQSSSSTSQPSAGSSASSATPSTTNSAQTPNSGATSQSTSATPALGDAQPLPHTGDPGM